MMITALAHYTEGPHDKPYQVAFIDGPRAFNTVLQAALRGGLEYQGCNVGHDQMVTLHFVEDTGLERIDHRAIVQLLNVDDIERQALKEWAQSFGMDLLTDYEDAAVSAS